VLPIFASVLQIAGSASEPDVSLGIGQQAAIFVLLGVVLPMPMSAYGIPCMLYVTSLFPAKVRGRGAGISYGLASLSGGLTPLICGLLSKYGDMVPAVFVTALTMPSLLALFWSRRAAARGRLQVYQRPWLF